MKICRFCRAPIDRPDWHCAACGKSPAGSNGWISFAGADETVEGFDPSHFEILNAMEERSFWFRSRNRLIVWALRRFFPNMRSFMEIGCGTGYVLSGVAEAFPGAELSACEAFDAGLEHAHARVPRAQLYRMDAKSLPFSEEFDVAGAFDVLEHIREDEEVLSEMNRAVKPGGGLVLTVPQHPFLWSRFDEFSRHVRRYRARDLRDKVERAGFKSVRTISFVSLLFPFVALARFGHRFKKAYDGGTELKQGRLLDALLEKTMDAERSLIRAGVTFPFGSSLLLVAEKK